MDSNIFPADGTELSFKTPAIWISFVFNIHIGDCYPTILSLIQMAQYRICRHITCKTGRSILPSPLPVLNKFLGSHFINKTFLRSKVLFTVNRSGMHCSSSLEKCLIGRINRYKFCFNNNYLIKMVCTDFSVCNLLLAR